MTTNVILYSLIIIAVIAMLTFGARFFPFLIFGREGGKIPEIVTYLGNVLPPAVMILLIVYCIRFVSFNIYPYGIPELSGICLTFVLYIITKNNLIAMVSGTLLYMFLVQVIFS